MAFGILEMFADMRNFNVWQDVPSALSGGRWCGEMVFLCSLIQGMAINGEQLACLANSCVF